MTGGVAFDAEGLFHSLAVKHVFAGVQTSATGRVLHDGLLVAWTQAVTPAGAIAKSFSSGLIALETSTVMCRLLLLWP